MGPVIVMGAWECSVHQEYFKPPEVPDSPLPAKAAPPPLAFFFFPPPLADDANSPLPNDPNDIP